MLVTVEDFAEEFNTTLGRLKATLKALEDAGLITISGDATQLIVPTVRLLCHQDRHLSDIRSSISQTPPVQTGPIQLTSSLGLVGKTYRDLGVS
jgi:hypothetical protein